MTDCPICIETYDETHYSITCRYCNYKCCCICVQRYLLNTVKDPHCMNCNKE